MGRTGESCADAGGERCWDRSGDDDAHTVEFILSTEHTVRRSVKARPDAQAVNTLPVDGGDVISAHSSARSQPHSAGFTFFVCSDGQEDNTV